MEAEFDRYAETYEAAVDRAIGFAGREREFYIGRKSDELLQLVEARFGDPRSVSALDVGCGPGLTDRFLAGRIGELHGVDVSPEMVARAGAENPSVSYQVSDATSIPHEDGRFDVTFAICVLHHVDRAQRGELVREMARVTRPRGLVVVFEHNPLNPLTRLVVRNCDFDRDAELLRPRSVLDLYERAGLRRVATRYILVFPWRVGFLARVERVLGSVPLGAQYLVAGSPA